MLVLLAVLGLALRVAYVLLTEGGPLRGDAPEYDLSARLAADGMWFYTDRPYGIVHEGMWKAPVYPAFLGVVYEVFGPSPTAAALIQALLGPVVTVLVWALARRLFDTQVALVSAAVATFYPNLWLWQVEMLPEGFALPLALIVMILVLERDPSRPRAAVVGAVMGFSLLVRPTQFFLFALVLAAWWIAAGARRGLALTALSILVAGLVVAPWTVRNYLVADDFIPISMQDAAAYGTFNDEAANDSRLPYAWRAFTARERDLFDPRTPLPDGELRRALQRRAADYIADHPFSLLEAFYWNGLSRTWDIRRPAHVLNEADFENRSRSITAVGLGIYWLTLGLALWGMWKWRRRRSLVIPLLAAALAGSVVFTTVAFSRYRQPLEPVLVILAVAAALSLFGRRGDPTSTGVRVPQA